MKKVYPKLEFEYDEVWMGRRPTTPDSMPVLGESPDAPNDTRLWWPAHRPDNRPKGGKNGSGYRRRSPHKCRY